MAPFIGPAYARILNRDGAANMRLRTIFWRLGELPLQVTCPTIQGCHPPLLKKLPGVNSSGHNHKIASPASRQAGSDESPPRMLTGDADHRSLPSEEWCRGQMRHLRRWYPEGRPLMGRHPFHRNRSRHLMETGFKLLAAATGSRTPAHRTRNGHGTDDDQHLKRAKAADKRAPHRWFRLHTTPSSSTQSSASSSRYRFAEVSLQAAETGLDSSTLAGLCRDDRKRWGGEVRM
jgi:hypothetical protein